MNSANVEMNGSGEHEDLWGKTRVLMHCGSCHEPGCPYLKLYHVRLNLEANLAVLAQARGHEIRNQKQLCKVINNARKYPAILLDPWILPDHSRRYTSIIFMLTAQTIDGRRHHRFIQQYRLNATACYAIAAGTSTE